MAAARLSWPAAAFLAFFLLAASSARAEIGLYFRHYEDASRHLGIDQILAVPQSEWREVNGSRAAFGPTKSRIWLRFSIPEGTPHPTDPVMIEINNGILDTVELYAVLDGKVIRHSRTGVFVPFHERDWGVVQTGMPTFRVPSPRELRTEYFLSATSHFPLSIPVKAQLVKEFYVQQWGQQLFLGLLFGTLLMAALFNGFLAISLGSALYRNYALFVATQMLTLFVFEGLSAQLLWKDWPWLVEREFPIFGTLAAYFYSRFLRDFLQTRAISPRIDRLIVICVGLTFAGTAGLMLSPRIEFSMVSHLSMTGINIFSLVAAVQALKKKVNAARYFFASSLVFNLSIIAAVAQETSLIHIGSYVARGPHIGLMLEVLLLSFALADRIRTTNRELAQQKTALMHSEKMSTLGRMAGEIAHEINNPLAIIHGNAALIRRPEASPQQMKEFAAAIEQTANRISKIVKGMRSLARDSSGDPLQKVPAASLLQDSVSLCRDRMKYKDVKLEIVKPDHELYLHCRSSEICQVLVNLIGNALDEVENLPSPWIRIEVRELHGAAEISVTDSGPGIPKEIRARLLEPFFTTKEPGKGLGLGLSISRSIVEAHGGRLLLDESAAETRFSFTLPLASADS